MNVTPNIYMIIIEICKLNHNNSINSILYISYNDCIYCKSN